MSKITNNSNDNYSNNSSKDTNNGFHKAGFSFDSTCQKVLKEEGQQIKRTLE